jgi:outer membrane autotransporter protein
LLTSRQPTAYFQGGADLYLNQSGDGRRTHAGVTLRIGSVNNSANYGDRALAGLSTHTGKTDVNAVGVGGYYTRYADDGTYVDLVGEVNRYEASYSDVYQVGGRQTGYGMVLSAEAGKPLPVAGAWKIEPQAQLAYQYLNMRGFSDAVSNISGTTDNALRGRLGARLFMDASQQSLQTYKWQPYIVADVLRDFMGARDVTVGSTAFDPNFAQTWWQAGAGLTLQLARTTHFYGDVKYQHAFGNGREGFAGHAGVRWNW